MSEAAPSRISQLLDWVFANVKAALPDHVELIDADDLTANPQNILAKGYGVTVGDGENSEECLEDSAYYYLRNFTIIITREVLTLASDTETNLAKLKYALEDLNAVLKGLVGVRTATLGTKVLSYDFKFVRDSGPRPTVINDVPHVFIELTVTAKYREPKT